MIIIIISAYRRLTELQDGWTIAQGADEDGVFRRHVVTYLVQVLLLVCITQ